MLRVSYEANRATIEGSITLPKHKLEVWMDPESVEAYEEAGLPFTDEGGQYFLYREESSSHLILTGLLGLIGASLRGASINSSICDTDISPSSDLNPQLRYYQKEAIEAALNKRRCLIKLPTGSGKTWVIGELMRLFLGELVINVINGIDSLPKMVVTVPTRALLYQMKSDLQAYMETLGVSINIGLIGDGNRDWDRDVIVAIPDSLISIYERGTDSNLEDLSNRCAIWVGDECHTLANPSGVRVSNILNRTRYRIGLSATPWTNTGMDRLLIGIFGTMAYEMSEREAIDAGCIMQPQVLLYQSPKAWAPKPLLSRGYSHGVYSNLYKHLILNNAGRNKLIARLAVEYMNKGEAPLAIIVSKVNTDPNHPGKILPLLQEAGYNLPVVHGKTKSKDFNQAIEDLKEFRIPGAIFGPGVMKEGVNIKGLGCVLLAGAGSSDIALLQRVGRALRSDEGKSQPTIIDIYDQQSFFLRQAEGRMLVYMEKYGKDNVRVVPID